MDNDDLLKWLDDQIEECENLGITNSVALNAQIATLVYVRNFVEEQSGKEK